jgi:hypothetical protein
MSNKKQTAIQELISEFQELKNTKIFKNSIKSIDECIDLAYSKLEMEKQHIVDAVENGGDMIGGKEYYNENYENN